MECENRCNTDTMSKQSYSTVQAFLTSAMYELFQRNCSDTGTNNQLFTQLTAIAIPMMAESVACLTCQSPTMCIVAIAAKTMHHIGFALKLINANSNIRYTCTQTHSHTQTPVMPSNQAD